MQNQKRNKTIRLIQHFKSRAKRFPNKFINEKKNEKNGIEKS